MEKKVLIVGVNTDIGIKLAKRLLDNKGITLAVSFDKKNEIIEKELKNLASCDVFPSVLDVKNANSAVENADFVINLQKIPKEKSAHYVDETEQVNYFTVKNLVDAINKNPNNKTRFLELSSASIYGAHTPMHPYARVGDPIMPALYDVYSLTCARAERYLIENSNNFLSIRCSDIFSNGTINKWLFDGYIFQHPLNSPFDYVSCDEVVELLYKIITDEENKIKFNSIYNFGGTIEKTWLSVIKDSLDTLKISSNIMSAKWFAIRNGNTAWLKDGNVLREIYNIREKPFAEYIIEQNDLYNYTKKIGALSMFIKKVVQQKVENMRNAPLFWKENVCTKRVETFYKGYSAFNEIQENINKYEEFRNFGKELENIKFDADGFANYDDLCEIAKDRGGKFVSNDYKLGDIHTKYVFECGKGHTFRSTPFAVMVGGYWCSDCMPAPWNYSELVKTSRYHSRIYFDEWDKEENIVVTHEDYRDIEIMDRTEYTKNTDKIKKYRKG